MSDNYSVTPDFINSSLDQLDGLEAVMEEDLENLDELLSEMSEMELTFRSGFSNGKSDTEKVLEVYENTFHDMDGRTDVQSLDEKLPLSSPATEFMAELTNLASIGKDQAYSKANFLDDENNLAKSHYNELVIYFESFKQVREELSVDLEGERESLIHYSDRIDDLAENLLTLSEENPFSHLDVADAGNILEELEEYEERIKQLKKRRVHEIKRRPEIYDQMAENNFVKAYEEATGSKTPVIEELDYLEERVDEAYENVVSAF